MTQEPRDPTLDSMEAVNPAFSEAEFERLVALGMDEATANAEWLSGTASIKLTPFALRGLAHSFGLILDRVSPSPAIEHVVGDGWKLVPVEPTEAMLEAVGFKKPVASAVGRLDRWLMVGSYRAMLASAPQPPLESGEPVAYVLMPRKLTSAIRDAFFRAWVTTNRDDGLEPAYAAMLEAQTSEANDAQ